jgi:4-hydroxy-tetrahydrodipicolinate synthase
VGGFISFWWATSFRFGGRLRQDSAALVGFAGATTAEFVRMQRLAEQQKTDDAYEIWGKLGPVAGFCWSAPLRDYRVRIKQLLVLQGVLPNSYVRGPTSQVSGSDAARLQQLVRRHGLLDQRFMPEGASASRR